VDVAQVKDVHEDDLLVGVFDGDEAADEVLLEHVQHFDVVALRVNLKCSIL
jgi:hypothetical protein